MINSDVNSIVETIVRQNYNSEGVIDFAIRDKLTAVVQFALQQSPPEIASFHLRPQTTGLAVPITLQKDGTKLIKFTKQLYPPIGKGNCKKVKKAYVLVQNGPLREAAAATDSDAESVGSVNEKYIQLLIQSKGSNKGKGIVELLNIAEYTSKKEETKKISFFMEWCNGGTAVELLMSNFHSELYNSEPTLLDEELATIAEDFLIGLDFLHDLRILHSDLNLRNLLIIKKGGLVTGAKICDFGYSRDLNSPDHCFFLNCCTEYRPPELAGDYKGKPLDKSHLKCDIYSAGMVLEALYCGRIAEIEHLSNTPNVVKLIAEKEDRLTNLRDERAPIQNEAFRSCSKAGSKRGAEEIPRVKIT